MTTDKPLVKLCVGVTAVLLIAAVVFLGVSARRSSGTVSIPAETEARQTADSADKIEENSAVRITLTGEAAEISGGGAVFSGKELRITDAGSYLLSGNLSDGSVVVDADKTDKIHLLLSGVTVSNSDGAALVVEQADKVTLFLCENTENTFSDGAAYTGYEEGSKIDGCIYSRDDLTVEGTGTLNVTGNLKHGIVCNDDLVFSSGTVCVTAKQDAVHAHDSVTVKGASLTLSAGDDGITVSNDDQTDYLLVESGNVTVSSCYEGLEATTVTVSGGNVSIYPTDDGINAQKLISVTGGNIRIENPAGRDADGLDSNGDIRISGGELFISVSAQGGSCAIDYGSEQGGTCVIDGGTVLAFGGSQMVEAISETSAQAFYMGSHTGTAGSLFSLTAPDGTVLLSAEVPCPYNFVTVSAPGMRVGDICVLSAGGGAVEVTIASSYEIPGMGGMGGFRDGRGTEGGFDGRGNKPDMGAKPGRGWMPDTGENPGEMPEMPDEGGMPAIPDMPGEGGMPDMPEMPGEGGMPAMPEMPGMREMPDKNEMPQMPGMDAPSDMPLPPDAGGFPDAMPQRP